MDVEEIHLLHHAHTDVGYTHDGPIALELHRRFLDRAIDLAGRDRDDDGPAAFRWTVEATLPLLDWLESASPERIERFRDLEDAGRIEVTAMLANVTPLYDTAELVESLRPVRALREEHGLEVRYAMNGDVNGQNWPLADALLDVGVEGFAMAINGHYGGSPFPRPTVFRWEAPSGRTLPTLNGYHYSTGLRLGIGRDVETLREEWWPRLRERLRELDYPLPALPVPSFHPFGDNGPPFDGFTDFVREWNDQDAVGAGDLPRLRMATIADWWDAVGDHLDDLPTYRGDWTDFWNFGAASSARETAINRESRRRLLTADAAEAALGALDGGYGRSAPEGTREEAWRALHLYDEHTWGADTAVSVPGGEDASAHWHHKAGYAYDARSAGHLLRRDAVADIARRVRREGDE